MIKAWKWISDPKNSRVMVFAVFVVLLFLLLKSCSKNSRLEAELEMKEINITALQDSVRTEKTRSGELQQVKTALMADLKDLKKLNIDLYKEVKDQKQKVFYISKLIAEIVDKMNEWTPGGEYSYDPVDGTDNISWKFDTAGAGWSRDISGKTSFRVISTCEGYAITPIGSVLEHANYSFGLTTGLKKSEKYPDNLEIFVKSTYPGMVFTSIEGSLVNPDDFKDFFPSPREKRWSFGPYLGIGYGVTLEKVPQLLPTLNVGVGVQYKLISF